VVPATIKSHFRAASSGPAWTPVVLCRALAA
jgi:hypothetical protein